MKTTSIPVSFVIPTFRGLALLQKHLPSVLAQVRSGDTIIISEDDASDTANSAYWQKRFKLQESQHPLGTLYQGKIKHHQQTINLLFLRRRHNGRFAINVNQAVSLVKDKYFILLNDDVELLPGAREQLLKTISQSEKIFAVGAREHDYHSQQISGRNLLWWRAGRFAHARASEAALKQAGDTAWVCGGSGIFSTAIWRQLQGFDTRYYPAYWEDIDLSYRAKKHGYQVLYQPAAQVEHIHETTNASVFGQKRMVAMSWRGGNLFSWKHGNWWQKLQFLFLYPYWQQKQFPTLRFWYLLLAAALCLRLGGLNIPNGLTVDEAAIAYNGYGLITTRRDEWLNRLPLSLRSFGDYKAPLAAYVSGLFTGTLGLEIVYFRLPFALAGVVSIWLSMQICRLIVNQFSQQGEWAGLLMGIFFTLSPWHLHFSHLGFENNFALLFSLWGLYELLKSIYLFAPHAGVAPLIKTALCWSLALYSYHAAKVSLPIFAILLLIYYWRSLKFKIKPLVIAAFVGALSCLPLLHDHLYGEGLTRAGSSFLFNQEFSLITKMQLFAEAFFAHLRPAYLWGGQVNLTEVLGDMVPNLRHGDGHFGVLTLGASIFILVFLLFYWRHQQRRQLRDLVFLGLSLWLVGTLPACLTTTIPHANQALLALPGLMLLATAGFLLWDCPCRYREQLLNARYLLIVLMILSFLPRWQFYQQTFAAPAGEHLPVSKRQAAAVVDYLFAVELISALKQAWQQREVVDTIIISTGREHEYIYALLASGISPESYQGGLLSSKILYLPNLSAGDWHRPNTIVVTNGKQWLAQDQEQLAIAQVKHFNHHSPDNDLFWVKLK